MVSSQGVDNLQQFTSVSQQFHMLIRFIFVDDGAIHLHSQFPIFGPKNINLFNCLLIIGGVVSRFLLQSVLEVKV